MESWTCIARKSRRVARDSDATRNVKEEKKGKVQRADRDQVSQWRVGVVKDSTFGREEG